MKNTRVLAVSLIALLASVAMGGASTGNCEKKAASLKSQQNVSLVNCWDPDPEFGGYMDYGCYYYKVKLSKGESFSIWLTGGDSEEMRMSVYPKESEDDFYMTSFEEDSTDDGSIQYARLTGSDWDEEDPSELTFIIEITGEIGAQATLYSESGYKTFVPLGMEDNPDTITFSEGQKELAATFVNGGEYWLKAQLRKGRMYRVRTAGASGSGQYTFEEVLADDEQSVDLEVYNDPFYASDTNNAAFVFSPLRDGTYTFLVSNIAGGDTSFSLFYEMLKAKTPSQHDVLALDAGNGYSTTFVPGRRVASWDFADNIIDEHLSSIYLAKGDRYVFETSGATEDLHMVVYDAKGNILAENRTKDGVGKDVRTVIEAESAGTYYVGVCNDSLEPYQNVEGTAVTLTAASAKALDGDPDGWDSLDDTTAGASGLEVLPGTLTSSPSADGALHGPHRLSATDWADNFVIAARAGITYRVGFEFASPEETSKFDLSVEVFTLSGSKEKALLAESLNPAQKEFVEFTASANQAYYIRCRVADGKGLDYPAYNVRSVAYSAGGAGLGILTVNTFGTTEGAWSLDKESTKYPGGSSVLLSGTHTVKFVSVKGFSTPASRSVTVTPGTEPTVVSADYMDTSDPKDDTQNGAVAMKLSNKETTFPRTLLAFDAADYFSFSGEDGCYYDFALKNVTGDAVFSIVNGGETIVEGVTSVSRLPLEKKSVKYYLVVKHGTADNKPGSYTLAGFFAKVGAINFAKTAVKAKENAASVKLTVNRTAKDGKVRVRYGTVAGTAQPGVDYVPQTGVLEWADGDNKAKTVEIRLIPDLVAHYEGDKSFKLRLAPLGDDEIGEGEYAAQIVGGDECSITLNETSRAGTTIESAYAAKAVKAATVKTENVALSSGTFYGVLAEDGFSLQGGSAALASVTLTVAAKNPAALSAKVAVGGKNYKFAATGWDDVSDGICTKTFELVQKIGGDSYVNTMTVRMAEGNTASSGDWKNAGADVELVMNIPTANSKDVQENIVYAGRIHRDNSKVQDYLTAVTNFAGYYTVALAPQGVDAADGVPAGNGYLTLKIDNKGAVKAAGMLADGKTKPSVSVKACAIRPDETSANGYSMFVPLFMSKGTVCFGGELRIFVDRATGLPVVDSTRALVWNDDDPKSTYYNEEGFKMTLEPIGGWYDLLVNLQAYYLTSAFETETPEVSAFPTEFLAAGYGFAGEAQPNGTAVGISGDKFETAKKSLVKDGKLYDLAGSVNPCNVQVKLARATGIVTGTFSVWSDNSSSQKEVSGFKHNGVLVLSRDSLASLGDIYAVMGFFGKSVSVSNVDSATGRTVKHTWNYSAPFNILAVAQGDVDWWQDDWGEQPVE